jgi:hypothetical protein
MGVSLNHKINFNNAIYPCKSHCGSEKNCTLQFFYVDPEFSEVLTGEYIDLDLLWNIYHLQLTTIVNHCDDIRYCIDNSTTIVYAFKYSTSQHSPFQEL